MFRAEQQVHLGHEWREERPERRAGRAEQRHGIDHRGDAALRQVRTRTGPIGESSGRNSDMATPLLSKGRRSSTQTDCAADHELDDSGRSLAAGCCRVTSATRARRHGRAASVAEPRRRSTEPTSCKRPRVDRSSMLAVVSRCSTLLPDSVAKRMVIEQAQPQAASPLQKKAPRRPSSRWAGPTREVRGGRRQSVAGLFGSRGQVGSVHVGELDLLLLRGGVLFWICSLRPLSRPSAALPTDSTGHLVSGRPSPASARSPSSRPAVPARDPSDRLPHGRSPYR